ncbi:MAG: MarR family transcriptional regulator [Bacteriovoracaceae bacterium]|nr:MarR family transcriptional regulator [Bacteriovoracaceae bacterium]
MEDALKAEGLPSLETYDVLWILEQMPEKRMRFNDLGERVYLSRSNITRLAERLEKEGYITRDRCPMDRRGVWAVLTPEGVKVRRKIWDFYKKEIEVNYSSKLTQKEHKNLAELLERFLGPKDIF